jgi:hypothetical protein
VGAYGADPRPVAPGIQFNLKVDIDLPGQLNGRLYEKVPKIEGWKTKRSGFKNRVTYRCTDLTKHITTEQWIEIRALLLLLVEI